MSDAEKYAQGQYVKNRGYYPGTCQQRAKLDLEYLHILDSDIADL